MMKRCVLYLSLLAVWLCHVSCAAKMQILEDFNPPVSLTQSFTSCQSESQGAFQLSGVGAVSVTGNWIRKRDEWILQFSNPIGQEVGRFSYNKNSDPKVSLSRLPWFEHQLSVDKNEFLSVDGNFVPIRVDEMGCFFSGNFPSRWLAVIAGVNHRKDGMDIEFYDESREIKMLVDGLGPASIKRVCAEIGWSRFFGMVKQTMTICSLARQPKESSLRWSSGNIELIWREVE